MSFTFKKFVRLDEMAASPQVTMPLQEVITAGKVTNMVQIVIMAQLIGALKHFRGGDAARYINEITGTASYSVVIDSLKKMPASDQVQLARELLQHINQEYDLYPNTMCGNELQHVSNIQK